MDKTFKDLIEGLANKYESLVSMAPVTVDTVPSNAPKGGVYLFTENGQHMYAGRTKRRMKDRLAYHVSTAKDCPFAWRLAREKTGQQASYKKSGSRDELLRDPGFKREYEAAKERIRRLEVRYVGEEDAVKQALLEIYVAVVSGALHNDFDTH